MSNTILNLYNLILQIITTIRFLAQSAYQRGVGKESDVGMSQPSVSKVLNEVIESINLHLLHKYIKFPTCIVERQRITEWYGFKYTKIISIITDLLFFFLGSVLNTIFLG